ncbi:uncharacterized protein LOC143252637 isoform X3 [Tachypleus tridentatus]|uniref:uncharacterized protein LOC143252637 isoform X3 n=1 Tax=Tachypleus tridentatus TaxID=6853 RepID=UPI003FD58B36
MESNTGSSLLFRLLQLVLVLGVQLGNSSSSLRADDVDKDLLQSQLKAYWMCRLNVTDYVRGNDFCPPEFDGWGCWKATSAGHVAKISCSAFGSLAENKNFVTRSCLTGGKWAINRAVGGQKNDYYSPCQLKQTSVAHQRLVKKLINAMDELQTSPYATTGTTQEFERCVYDVLSKPQPTDKLYCPATFDGWSCWNATPAGNVVYVPCPVFVTGFQPRRFAHKMCEEDGNWFLHPKTNKTWSNYTTCVDKEDLSVQLGNSSSSLRADDVDKDLLQSQLKAYWMCRLNVTDYVRGNDFCPPEFDGWGCWKATSAGHVAKISCPTFGSLAENKNFVTRSCLTGGKWAINRAVGGQKNDYYSPCQLKQTSVTHKRLVKKLINAMDELQTSPYATTETSQEFERCVYDVLSKPQPIDKLYCPATFDGWSCWNATPAGDVVYVPCPVFVTGFQPRRFAHKMCEEDGNWFLHPKTNKTWSNYTTCVDKEDLSFRDKINKLYIAGYSISVIALSMSLAIFFYFRSLKCTRITIHKNLFISFIINNILWIVWYTEVIRYPEVLFSNKPACQVLHVLVHYFLTSNYMWMFCEGLYLHTLLVVAFVAEEKIMKWFYILGWGSPMLVIVAYASLRSSYPEETVFCWIEESRFTWVISGPVCIFMLLNFVFLINIVRVLVTKLRADNSPDNHQTRKAVRATLILIPLLGLHYIITPFRPEPGSPEEVVYEPISAVVASFQGLCVSLLFCFFNGEVISLIKKKWNQAFMTWGNDTKRNYAVTTMSVGIQSCKRQEITWKCEDE